MIPPSPSGSRVTPYSISGDGNVVVGWAYDSTYTRQAFTWDAVNGITLLGDLPGGSNASFATGVSFDGSTIVGVGANEDGFDPFYWNSTDGLTGLNVSLGGGASVRSATISDDGNFIVGTSYRILSENNSEGYRWDAINGFLLLGSGTWHPVISGDGLKIAGTNSQGLYLWTEAGGAVDLGKPVGANSVFVRGISRNGNAIVGYFIDSDGDWEAYLWDSIDGFTNLGHFFPAGTFSVAYDISGDGRIVVGQSDIVGGDRQAFVWTKEIGMRNLKTVLEGQGVTFPADMTLDDVYGISDDGSTVTGAATEPGNSFQGYIASGLDLNLEPVVFDAEVDLQCLTKVEFPTSQGKYYNVQWGTTLDAWNDSPRSVEGNGNTTTRYLITPSSGLFVRVVEAAFPHAPVEPLTGDFGLIPISTVP